MCFNIGMEAQLITAPLYGRLLSGPPAGYRRPTTKKEKMVDPFWRLNSIHNCVNEDAELTTFKMRLPQNDFFWRMHYFNIILKSRQHGFTTFCAIMALDRSMFLSNYTCHFIQQTRNDSLDTFDKKFKSPYERLIREHPELPRILDIETDKDNTRVLKFTNGSSISTGTTARGGTVNFLHVSEFAQICEESPRKSTEIQSGSLNTVHPGNFKIIESTARGRSGIFYTLVTQARDIYDKGRPLTGMDYQFHFYPWWSDPKCVMFPEGVDINKEDKDYFEKLLRKDGIRLSPGQKVYYIKKKAEQGERIFREYPSTPDEAFQGQIERKTYGRIMVRLRRDNRIQPYIPFEPGIEVNTAWDLGKNDENAIWLHQYIRYTGMHRWLMYYENNGFGLQHYWSWLLRVREEHNIFFGKHFLPHDVMVSEMTMAKGETRRDHLERLGMRNIVVVQRVPNLADGIEATRQVLENSEFSEIGCEEGIKHLGEYEAFQYDDNLEATKQTRSHHKHSNAADAARQIAQEWVSEIAYQSGGGNNAWDEPVNWRVA